MATPAEMVTLLKNFLATNAGVVTIRHADGREVRYDRKQALAELAYWEQKAAAADSTTGMVKFCEVSLKGQN